MKNFDFKAQIQNIIDSKQLVELNIATASIFKVGFLLNMNDKFFTFVEIGSDTTFQGIHVCKIEDLEMLKVETIYLNELSKRISIEDNYKQVKALITGIKSFSFQGIASAFEGTNNIIQIALDSEDDYAGRIIGHDDSVLLMDEYYSEYASRYARTYIRFDQISRMAIDAPWLRTIELAVEYKHL